MPNSHASIYMHPIFKMSGCVFCHHALPFRLIQKCELATYLQMFIAMSDADLKADSLGFFVVAQIYFLSKTFQPQRPAS